MFFADASLGDLSGGTNIDISNRDGFNIISLKSDLQDISSITLDSSLVFNLSDGSSITIIAPSDISNEYTLTLPSDLSLGGYLKADHSGHLSFINEIISSSQADISLVSKHTNLIIDPSNFNGDISGFIFDLCDNLIVTDLTISGGELKINHDSSLVFHTQDGNSITIVAPPDASAYTLTLPSDLSAGGSGNKTLVTNNDGTLNFQDIKSIRTTFTLTPRSTAIIQNYDSNNSDMHLSLIHI